MTEPGTPSAPNRDGPVADGPGAGSAADAADTPDTPRLELFGTPGAEPGGSGTAAGDSRSSSAGPDAAAAVDAVALALQAQMAAPAGSASSSPAPAAAPSVPGATASNGDAVAPSVVTIAPPTGADPGRSAGLEPDAAAPVRPGTSPTAPLVLGRTPVAPAPPETPGPSGRAGRSGRAGARPDDSVFWRYGFPAAIVLLTLALPLLVWAGRKTVLQSTDGKVLTEVTDQAAPGWTALTDPTPTMLLVQTDAAGQPTGLTVMALTGEGSGGLIFLPMTTVLDLPDIGKLPLNAVYEKTGIEGLQKAVEGVLGAGMSEVRVVSPQELTDLVTPVGPITVSNPDDVTVADAKGQRTVVFPKGTLTLEPKDVPAYLSTTSPGENDLNRLERQKAFWDAWLRKVGASSDPAVVPGEADSGLGRFIRALAASRVEMSVLPVQGAGIPGTSALVYVPIKDQVSSLVARLVPFPIGAPPGARPRVRLLDGTGKLDHGLRAAPLIVEGGGQVDQIGNAPAFGQATTTLTYYDDAQRDAVEKLRAALGVGEVVKGTTGGSAVDVTVVLGADFLAQPPRSVGSVSTLPSGSATTTIVGINGG